MARNSNYNISLNLLYKKFDAGLKKAGNSLKRFIKSATFKLGAVMGFGSLTNDALDAAKALEKAETTLKNVSGTMNEFGKNQEFVRRIADRYSQDIIILTQNFAKFRAAAKESTLELKDQYHIYESFTKAAAFYNLTQDETNGVFLALSQMLSKGKVSSEELRLQLGERLPGAMTVFAKALGVSTVELDKMMRTGTLRADEALKAVANYYDELTGGMNLDNITANMTKVKNSFTNLVDRAGISKGFNSLLKMLNKLLGDMTKNFKNWAIGIGSVIGGLIGSKMWGGLKKFWANAGTEMARKQGQLFIDNVLNKKMREPVDNRNDDFSIWNQNLRKLNPYGEFKFDEKKAKAFFATNEKFLELTKEQQKEIRRLGVMYSKYATDMSNDVALATAHTSKLQRVWVGLGKAVKRTWISIKSAVASILPAVVVSAIIGGISKIISYFHNLKQEVKDFKEEMDGLLSDYNKNIENAALSDDPRSSALKSHLKDYKDALDVLNDPNTNGRDRELAENKQISTLKSINSLLERQGDLAFGLNSTYEDIAKSVEEALEKFKTQRKMSAITSEYDKAMANRPEIQNKIDDLEDKIRKIETEQRQRNSNPGGAIVSPARWWNNYFDNNELEKLNKELAIAIATRTKNEKAISELDERFRYVYANEIEQEEDDLDTSLENDYTKIQADYAKELQILLKKNKDGILSAEELKEAKRRLAESTLDEVYSLDASRVGTDEFTKNLLALSRKIKKNALDDLFKDFSKNKTELDNKLKNGAISTDEYNDAMDRLNIELWEAIASMGDFTDTMNDQVKAARKNAEDARKRAKEREADEKKANSAKDAGDVYKDFRSQEWSPMPTRDTLNDYSKTQSEIAEERIGVLDEAIDNLKDRIKATQETLEKMGEYAPDTLKAELLLLKDTLGELEGKAKELNDVLRLEQAKEKVEEFENELNRGAYQSMESLAGATRSVVESVRDLTDILDDAEASGFEKILSVFDAMFQIVNAIMGQIDKLKELKNISESLAGARNALSNVTNGTDTSENIDGIISTMGGINNEASAVDVLTEAIQRENEALAENEAHNQRIIEQMMLQQQLGSDGSIESRMEAIEGLSKASDGLANSILSTSVAETSAAQKSVANSGAKVAASQAEAMGSGAAGAAKLPFPANLIAIAGTIAAIAAMFASIKSAGHFASGGVIGGNSYSGDKLLAHVNSKEMVLNQGQQAKLWNLINGAGTIGGVGGQVDFKIKGSDLVGTLNNYQKLHR